MRFPVVFLLAASAVVSSYGQTSPLPDLPKEPAAVFSVAAPLYDFNRAGMKPWHMKVTYQMYAETGQPTQQGTYDYWWASPNTYRSTWKLGASEYTDWHLEGQHSYLERGETPDFVQWKLKSDFLAPLPDPVNIDPQGYRFERQGYTLSGSKLPCVMVIPKMQEHGMIQTVPLGEFPTYCFDPHRPILRAFFAFGATSVLYDKVVKMQGVLLPKELAIYESGHRLLLATVETVDLISPVAPEFNPTPDATTVGKLDRVNLPSEVAQGSLIKSVRPIYPQDAKEARISGSVVISALIGRDGRVHDMRVIQATFPSLAGSAMLAVRQRQYTPYKLNGDIVEVETTINVIFKISD